MQSVSGGTGPQVTHCTHASPGRAGHTWGCSVGQAGVPPSLVAISPCLQAAPQILRLQAAARPWECCWGSCARAAPSEEQGCSQRSRSLALSCLKPRDVCGGPDGQEGVLGGGRRLAQCLAVEGTAEAAASPGWEHWELRLVSQAGNGAEPSQPYRTPALSGVTPA